MALIGTGLLWLGNALTSYVKLAPMGTKQDSIYWNKTPSGVFSSSSAMRVLRRDDESTPEPIWKLVWSVPCQQRIRQILYLVVHRVILCNQYRRHMSNSEGFP
ncbi:hypothetical protein V2J09_000266 [Rumex salicifolius]